MYTYLYTVHTYNLRIHIYSYLPPLWCRFWSEYVKNKCCRGTFRWCPRISAFKRCNTFRFRHCKQDFFWEVSKGPKFRSWWTHNVSKRNILVYFDVGTWTPCGCCSAEPPIALATHAVPITTVHLQEGTPCLHPNKASLQKSHEKASKKIRPCNGPWKNRQTWWNHIKPSYLRYLPSCPSCPSRVSHLGAPGCAAPAVFVLRGEAWRSSESLLPWGRCYSSV